MGANRQRLHAHRRKMSLSRKVGSYFNISRSSEYNMKVDPEFVRFLDHVFVTGPQGKIQSQVIDLTSDETDTSYSINPLPGTTTSEGPFRITYRTLFERNCKVGAAGELYVYRLLNHHLNGQLKMHHWQSILRNLVRQHAAYSEWSGWTGTETADIVFPDDSGDLTKLLIENGLLDPEKWAGKRPQYFIEVKSTLHSRDKEFYMSQKQVELMEKCLTTSSGPGRPEIYIIARVSNLQEQDIDLRLYVEPGLMSTGTLRFRQQGINEDSAVDYNHGGKKGWVVEEIDVGLE